MYHRYHPCVKESASVTNHALKRDGYICRFMVFTKNIGGLEENIDQWGDHAPYIFSISKHEYAFICTYRCKIEDVLFKRTVRRCTWLIHGVGNMFLEGENSGRPLKRLNLEKIHVIQIKTNIQLIKRLPPTKIYRSPFLFRDLPRFSF